MYFYLASMRRSSAVLLPMVVPSGRVFPADRGLLSGVRALGLETMSGRGCGPFVL